MNTVQHIFFDDDCMTLFLFITISLWTWWTAATWLFWTTFSIASAIAPSSRGFLSKARLRGGCQEAHAQLAGSMASVGVVACERVDDDTSGL
jgi:hypothetical protein